MVDRSNIALTFGRPQFGCLTTEIQLYHMIRVGKRVYRLTLSQSQDVDATEQSLLMDVIVTVQATKQYEQIPELTLYIYSSYSLQDVSIVEPTIPY